MSEQSTGGGDHLERKVGIYKIRKQMGQGGGELPGDDKHARADSLKDGSQIAETRDVVDLKERKRLVMYIHLVNDIIRGRLSPDEQAVKLGIIRKEFDAELSKGGWLSESQKQKVWRDMMAQAREDVGSDEPNQWDAVVDKLTN